MKVIYHRVRDGKTVEKLEVKAIEIMEYADGSLRLSLDFKNTHGLTSTSIPLIIQKGET